MYACRDVHSNENAVVQPEIRSLLVSGAAKEDLRFTDFLDECRRPYARAIAVRVVCEDLAALLAGQQQSSPVRQRVQNRRRAEIEIRPEIFRGDSRFGPGHNPPARCRARYPEPPTAACPCPCRVP